MDSISSIMHRQLCPIDGRMRCGDVVRHFKRETVDEASIEYIYQVWFVAEHTETKEKLVIYTPIRDIGKVYARPYNQFISKVNREKYPNIEQEYRFEPLTQEECTALWKKLYKW